MRKLLLALAAVASLAFASPAVAANVSLFGGATTQGDAIQLVSNVSNASTADDFSGIRITDLGGLTLGDLDFLSAQFNVTDDGCAQGSPRYVIMLANGAAVNVAFGPSPTFTGCQLNAWIDTGNLVGQLEGCRWHITSPPALADPCLTAAELAALANQPITEILLVVDAGGAFADGEQTVLVRNLLINSQIVSPTVRNAMAPGQLCKALRQSMGATLFASTFGTMNTSGKNAMGKCASMMAHLKKAGLLPVANAALLAAITTCKATPATASGPALTRCVIQQLTAALPTVRQFTTKAKPNKAKAKKGKKKP